MKKQAISLVLVLASGCPSLSQALSLGEIQFNSSLNQPFKARIELLQATEQELAKLQVHVAPPSIFAQARLQRPQFMDSLQFARSVKQGRHYLVITSSQPIAESEFSLLLEVTSPKGDLLKRYSVALVAEQTAKSELDRTQAATQNATEPLNLEPVTNNLKATETVLVTATLAPVQIAEETALESSSVQRPVVLPAEPSKRASANTPQVAIPLPKLAFKYRYRVRKADTIFSIAERLTMGQLNVDEKALALYARNPQAFVKGDITRLKVGAVLRTPTVVDKHRFVEPAPVLASRVAPPEAPVPVLKRNPSPKVQSVANPSLASAPMRLDPPLARAVYEHKLASELKLDDLQERLTQVQQLLTAKAKENNDLKDLVQEKNRLLTRREEELVGLQTQIAQQTAQSQALMAQGAAGSEGKAEGLMATLSTESILAENTWPAVFASPLVWKMTVLSSLFLVLVALWQKRRSEDQLMQLRVQNAILMPDDEADEKEGRVLDFLWGEDELEQATEQLQRLRHSMASLREQSQRLQVYLNPEPMCVGA